MADADLPVWSFRANWREPMTERLSFLTDVLRAEEGAEQRRSLRPTPRRFFECDLLLSGPERTFLDLFVNRLGGGEIMIPLYWDVATLLVAATDGVTDRLEFDTTGHEFAPGLAIISGKTAMDYEVVEIVAVDAGGIDLAEAVVRPWPKGAKVLPLRRGLIDGSSPVLAHRTGGVAVTTVGFMLTCPNPWEPAEDTSPMYLGRPVFLDEPNWVEGLDSTMDRETFRLDNETGVPYQVDALTRALVGQSHRWFLNGRSKLASFRDLIYRHRGRAGSFWLPTFKHDLKMVAPITNVSTTLVIENVGYSYTGGPTKGREYIAIKHAGGTILRKVISVLPGLLPNTERVGLDQSLGLALQPGQVLRISFADVARFDQDDFEITHHGGIDSLHEVQSVFRSFSATRNPAGAISFPIPAAAQSNTGCGVEASTDCYAPLFYGWYARSVIQFLDPTPGVDATDAGWVFRPKDGDGNNLTPIWYTDSANWPNGHPRSEYSPDNLRLTVYWIDPAIMGATDLQLSMQFGFGTVGAGMKAAFYWQFWDRSEITPIPGPGSDSMGNPFTVRSLWPDSWYFEVQ